MLTGVKRTIGLLVFSIWRLNKGWFYKIKRKLSRDGAFKYTRESFFVLGVCARTQTFLRAYIYNKEKNEFETQKCL